MMLKPINWFRLSSPFFDRSDLASEYYDKYVFEGKTYGDMLKRRGPMILINATDISRGTRVTFHQVFFQCNMLRSFRIPPCQGLCRIIRSAWYPDSDNT
ncbi:MAG: hypothetical protein ABSB79_04055 [Syntrophales bacterium]